MRRPSGDADGAEPLTLDEARLVAIAAQRLDGTPPPAPPSKESILKTIHALGCVQLDTISVVARSHETVLWSRLGRYDTRLLSELYDPDGHLTEYWAHAAAIIPVEALPYFRRCMALYRDPNSTHYAAWEPEPDVNEAVLTALRERGPLPSRAFERPAGPRPSPWAWWGGKPARKALDFLFTGGELTVLRRDGFERIYELMERRYPGFHGQDLPPVEDQRRFFVARALNALGVATPHWVADYFRTGSRPHVPPAEAAAELRRMETAGLACRVTVPGVVEPVWLDLAWHPFVARVREGRLRPERTTLLSPFDNLIWHRARTLALFGFEYRLESYTPATRRRYGYYTLPILHRGALVGRLDPIYDRRQRLLTVKTVHLEPGAVVSEDLAVALAAILRNYCDFLGGGEVRALASDPPELASLVSTALVRQTSWR